MKYIVYERDVCLIEEVKEKYKLRPTDRISKALDTIELLQNVMSTLKQ